MCTIERYGIQNVDYSTGRCFNNYGVAKFTLFIWSRSLNASNSKLHWSITNLGQSYYSDYSNPSAYYGVAYIV